MVILHDKGDVSRDHQQDADSVITDQQAEEMEELQ